MTTIPDPIKCAECATEDVFYDVLDETFEVRCSRFDHVIVTLDVVRQNSRAISAWKGTVNRQRQRRERENSALHQKRNL